MVAAAGTSPSGEADEPASATVNVSRAIAAAFASGVAAFIATVATAVAVTGCSSSRPASYPPVAYSSSRPVQHVVRPGETVYHIAHAYHVSVQSLLEANHLSDSRDLRVGQSLLIPGAYSYASLGGAQSGLSEIWNVPRASRQFAWPLWSGELTSGFGMRHGTMHDGVDIAAPVGTPVHAADSGVVAFVGKLNGYGNTVIIRHSDNYVTVYGHNSRVLVSEGTEVARGQNIAEVGTSGRTTGPNLHFEVRYDNRAYNPLSYLAPPGPSPGVSFARNGPS
ncbi:MAG TPA: LysM peptidoglycan-binding domain-containing M23 family metallopeptidase [Candidatus Binataceae bacterium]|nr:LysM peptidoglycan-binding domain-containing M23 family metallopeptidase [Candidatus Binataceae bacterium]